MIEGIFVDRVKKCNTAHIAADSKIAFLRQFYDQRVTVKSSGISSPSHFFSCLVADWNSSAVGANSLKLRILTDSDRLSAIVTGIVMVLCQTLKS